MKTSDNKVVQPGSKPAAAKSRYANKPRSTTASVKCIPYSPSDTLSIFLFFLSPFFPPPPTSFTVSNAIFRSKWKFVCGITMLLHILLVQRHYPHYLTIYLVSFRILPFLISLSSWKKKNQLPSNIYTSILTWGWCSALAPRNIDTWSRTQGLARNISKASALSLQLVCLQSTRLKVTSKSDSFFR